MLQQEISLRGILKVAGVLEQLSGIVRSILLIFQDNKLENGKFSAWMILKRNLKETLIGFVNALVATCFLF